MQVSIPTGKPLPFRQQPGVLPLDHLGRVSIPTGKPLPFRLFLTAAACLIGTVSIPTGKPLPFRPNGL